MSWWRQTLIKQLQKKVQSVEEEAAMEAMLLDRDILEKDLAIIDAQHKVAAQRAKLEHIANWLVRDKPYNVPTGKQ